MFKFLNYVRTIISFLIFSLLSACSDNGSFLSNRISGEEYGDKKEAKFKKYYTRLEERKISLGLLRQDGGGTDTPFDVDDVVEAFEQVAFYNEYDISGDKLLPNSEAVKLAKWKSNINISVRFGISVDKKQKDNDLLEINELIGVLSQVTNHNIKISQQNINMYVVIANQKEIKDLIAEIALLQPEFDPQRIPIITQLPRDIHCMAMTSMNVQANSGISSSLVIIRNELPHIMRKACIHEEIAQSLGLTNDSHLARPSVFNDDDEFATLTKFDEILLKILYDKRLHSGISKDKATQIVKNAADELLSSR